MALCDCHTCSELNWPEPLVIELIGEHLDQHPLTTASRRALARRHAAALHDMIVARDVSWRDARRELGEYYAALGLATERIATIDCAVFRELTRLAADRTRHSPRRRQEAAGMLEAAVGRLSATGIGRARPLAA